MEKKQSKINIKALIVIAGVIIIPLLYSFFYLGAFWDPYSRLETLPTAVVNLDEGASINGEERNLGEEFCKQLKENNSLKFVFTSEKDSSEGTKNGDYYAEIIIPEDFSENIASAETVNKQQAVITYSPNEQTNYLAAQILNRAVLEMEEKLVQNVDSEIVAQLAEKLQSVPQQMSGLQDGLNQLYQGSSELASGTESLKEGTGKFNSNFSQFSAGAASAASGSQQLNEGITQLNEAVSQLSSGADLINSSASGLDTLSDSVSALAQGAETFNESLKTYTGGVNSLIRVVSDTSAALGNYVKINPAIMQDQNFAAIMSKLADPENTQQIQILSEAGTKLQSASDTITQSTALLSSKSLSLVQLKQALADLSSGLVQAKEGSGQLLTGSQTLAEGTSTLRDAARQFSSASQEISDGALALDDGADMLLSGIETAKEGVDSSVSEANDEVKSLEGLSEYASSPVKIEQKNVVSVENYGTAFAPYFMSLSLWVGALIIFFTLYLDPDGKFKVLSRNSDKKIVRSFVYLLIGVTVALLLGIVLKIGLGLEVQNMTLYFWACILVSLVSIAIVQFLLVHLKDIGKFCAIVLLILQLTSCGGTFPMETVPKFFNVLYPYMPMTYAVDLFKQAINVKDTHRVFIDTGVLAGILIGFMILTVLLSVIKIGKRKKVLKVQEV